MYVIKKCASYISANKLEHTYKREDFVSPTECDKRTIRSGADVHDGKCSMEL